MSEPFLPYARPSVGEEELAAIRECIENGWLTTGPKVREFEQQFAALAGVRHAVALNSCTAGLHLGLHALGVGPGDEVIMPSLTFVAGAQCARELGAREVFADVDDALCITPETIERVITARTKVIMPMHYAGRPAQTEAIVAFARERGIAVLEDAAHAVGMLDRGRWSGALSDGAAYSFYPTKNITTTEGGMFLTNNDMLAERVRVLSLHGMNKDAWKRYAQGGKWRYDVVEAGYKYNMPDISAALGIVQLQKLENFQRRRDEIARAYCDAIASLRGVHVVSNFAEAPSRHAWCMFVIAVDEQLAGISRDQLIDRLSDAGIGTSVHYIPTHTFSAYRDPEVHLPNTDRLWPRILSLPLYPDMNDLHVERVIDALRRLLQSGPRRNASSFFGSSGAGVQRVVRSA